MDDNWLKIDIPLPWSARPARVHASGGKAVGLASLVAVALIVAVLLIGT